MIILFCFKNSRAAFRCSYAFRVIEKTVTAVYTKLRWSFLYFLISFSHSCTPLCAFPVPLSIMNYFRKTEPMSGVLFFLQTKLIELNDKAKIEEKNRLKFFHFKDEGLFLPKERKRERMR